MTRHKYETTDSGERVEFNSGMVRDSDTDKPRYDLMDRPMLKRYAELLARGAEKYGENNWKKADSPEELVRFQASAFRHFMQWLNNEYEEDHASAVWFNIAAAEMVRAKLHEQAQNLESDWIKEHNEWKEQYKLNETQDWGRILP